MGEHKPGRIKPGRIKRAALSLQHQNGYTFDVCRVKYPGTKQLPIHISGAGFAPNSQIWLLGTTPFDTTPFICLRVIYSHLARLAVLPEEAAQHALAAHPEHLVLHTHMYIYIYIYIHTHIIYTLLYIDLHSITITISVTIIITITITVAIAITSTSTSTITITITITVLV